MKYKCTFFYSNLITVMKEHSTCLIKGTYNSKLTVAFLRLLLNKKYIHFFLVKEQKKKGRRTKQNWNQWEKNKILKLLSLFSTFLWRLEFSSVGTYFLLQKFSPFLNKKQIKGRERCMKLLMIYKNHCHCINLQHWDQDRWQSKIIKTSVKLLILSTGTNHWIHKESALKLPT